MYNQILLESEYASFEKDILKGRNQSIKKYYANIIGQFPPQARVLDLGCGDGEFVSKLNSLGFDAIGIDANIEYANDNKYIKHGILPNVLEDIEDNYFDVIVSFHLIEHLDNESLKNTFRNMFRIIKDDGMVFLETPNTQSLFVMSKYYYMDPTHLLPRHPNSYGILLQSAGFDSVTIQHVTDIIDDIFAKKVFLKGDDSISCYICDQINDNFARIHDLLFDTSGNILITCKKTNNTDGGGARHGNKIYK